MTEQTLSTEPLVDTITVAKMLGATAAAVAQMRQRNEGPRFVKKGRFVRYRPEDVRAWIEEHTCSPTGQPKRLRARPVEPELQE